MINVIFSAIGERIKTTKIEIPIYVKKCSLFLIVKEQVHDEHKLSKDFTQFVKKLEHLLMVPRPIKIIYMPNGTILSNFYQIDSNINFLIAGKLRIYSS